MENEIIKYLEARIYEALDRIGDRLQVKIQERLEAGDHVATGDLVKSIAYNILKEGDSFVLEIGTNKEYLRYIEEGRPKGALMPPFEPIKKWVMKRTHKFASFCKPLNPGISKEQAIENMTWGIRVNMKKHGIAPFSVLDFVLKQNEKFIDREIQKAIGDVAEVIRSGK
jgi:hypothetical protein